MTLLVLYFSIFHCYLGYFFLFLSASYALAMGAVAKFHFSDKMFCVKMGGFGAALK